MVERVICFGLIFVIFGSAHSDQKASIQLTINSIAGNCAATSGMTAEQLQTAIQDKDIDRISPCFFKCYLSHYGLISQEDGRESVNVPVTLIFVKMYVPDITLFDLLSVGAEVMICARDFEKDYLSDDQPGCCKTKVLIQCLAKRETLINALWLATRS